MRVMPKIEHDLDKVINEPVLCLDKELRYIGFDEEGVYLRNKSGLKTYIPLGSEIYLMPLSIWKFKVNVK